jgi:hypothetical protein
MTVGLPVDASEKFHALREKFAAPSVATGMRLSGSRRCKHRGAACLMLQRLATVSEHVEAPHSDPLVPQQHVLGACARRVFA